MRCYGGVERVEVSDTRGEKMITSSMETQQ